MFKKTVFLFIPGFYGSTLLEKKQNRLVWGDPKELFFRRSTLALPIEGVKIKGVMDLHPHEVIPDMQILWGLLKEESYDRTLHFLKTFNPLEIVKVAWDWRKDPLHGANQLDRAYLNAKAKYPDAEFILVSHSYGSLVASYYLRYGTQDYLTAQENWEGLKKFKKVVLSACPYKGLMAIFRNMHKGIKFGLNHNMQDALSFCTFESSYFLLPHLGHDCLRDGFGNKTYLNLYDKNNWVKNRWGIFHDQHSLKENEKLEEFLEMILKKAYHFHQLIHKPMSDSFQNLNDIPLLYFYGHGFPTLHEGIWLNHLHKKNVFLYYPKDFKKFKFQRLKHHELFADGDLTVPDFSLKLPDAFQKLNIQVHTDHLGHLDILQSAQSQIVLKNFLLS